MDLIDRQTAYEVLTAYYHHKTETQRKALREALNKVPSADVQSVRHGHWIYTPTNILGYVCSECGKAMCRFNYCPHCGALMDEVT